MCENVWVVTQRFLRPISFGGGGEWVIDCVTRLKKYSWFLLKCGYQDTLVKFKMNQTENEIQRIMYHPLSTFVKRKEEITCSC